MWKIEVGMGTDEGRDVLRCGGRGSESELEEQSVKGEGWSELKKTNGDEVIRNGGGMKKHLLTEVVDN